MLPFEVALPVGAIAFYVYDCGMLLFDNELLLVAQTGRWRVTGGGRTVIFGKRICVPAPLAPWALVFRTYWSENDKRDDLPVAWPPPSLVLALRPVMLICGALLLLLLVVLPVVSLRFGTGLALLGVFGLYYILMLGALVIVYVRRRLLGLDRKSFWLLAIDVLACAPFAINLVRKITLRQATPVRPLDFGKSHLDARHQEQLAAMVMSRVDEMLAREECGSQRALHLAALRTQLQRETA